MKKILVYWPVSDIKPQGGPRGYLYNLKQGLDSFYHSNIKFSYLPQKNNKKIYKIRNLVRDNVPQRLRDYKRLRKFLQYPYITYDNTVDFSQYDAIHFHRVEDLYFNRKNLENYNGKVLLTTHTPCAPHEELYSRLNTNDYKHHYVDLQKLQDISKFAFNRADIIIFPCIGSEEPYFHTWKDYKDIRNLNKNKYEYLLTGIAPCYAKKSRKEIRQQYNIPDDVFLCVYAGRHNMIKGYDNLVDFGKQILTTYDDIWFIVAGRQTLIKPPTHPHWIEVGWTDDPHSLFGAADCFILPNKETYFDLVLLEALSMGIPVITSDTGGNKVFHALTPNDIYFYTNYNNFIKQILYIKNSNVNGDLNKKLFQSYFTCEKFAQAYVNLLAKVL